MQAWTGTIREIDPVISGLEVDFLCAETSKARGKLGWQPTLGFQELGPSDGGGGRQTSGHRDERGSGRRALTPLAPPHFTNTRAHPVSAENLRYAPFIAFLLALSC